MNGKRNYTKKEETKKKSVVTLFYICLLSDQPISTNKLVEKEEKKSIFGPQSVPIRL